MLECLDDMMTTYRKNFRPFAISKFAKKMPKIPQADPTLLTGYFRNNLQINGAQMKSKVWPNTGESDEELKDYVKRLECCKKLLYKLYFRCPDVDLSYLERVLRDLEKSTYQMHYSPNEFLSRNERRRLSKMSDGPTNMKYHDTTYRVYYSRIDELARFQNVLRTLLSRDEKDELKSDLRKIYRTGRTTYYGDLCVPALELAKTKVLKNTPIDCYTLRRF